MSGSWVTGTLDPSIKERLVNQPQQMQEHIIYFELESRNSDVLRISSNSSTHPVRMFIFMLNG
ncbi:hypothetical protein TWF106_003671 [Orbilia oligospora]|uniref:Uncharacterized protein n=1 Tax=Orbilia oligospora TaxID=2813651 RepID=A0A7C8Q8I4_ORBOL|nr:hypothetical protein TWF106_003671 [Orbilia oligospora]